MSQDIVANKKFRELTFKKESGRIVLYSDGKRVGGGRMVKDRLLEMKGEVRAAEAGYTVSTMKDLGDRGYEYKRHGVKSTFPEWYGEIGFRNKDDFMRVFNKKQGKRKDKLVNQAIEDLSEGYKTSFGPVPENQKFRLKTRQDFDNTNVIFRKIRGRIVPIKTKGPAKKQHNKYSDEVPF